MNLVPSTNFNDYQFTHQLRTRFAETDAMGIIHHASYLAYLEETRVEFLRHSDHPYAKIREDGIDLAVLEVFVQYRKPSNLPGCVLTQCRR
jgi:acyl-CoA thioester hydrolase